MAALVGGVIALLGAWVLGLMGGGDDVAARQEVDTLRTEIADMRESAGAGPTTEDVQSIIDERVAAVVEERLAEAAAEAAENGAGDTIDTAVITSLDERLARLEADEGARIDAGGMTPEIEARITDLESSIPTGSEDGERLAEIEARLETLTGTQSASDERLQTLLGELEQGGGASTETTALVEEIRGRLDELTSGAGDLDTRLGETADTIGAELAQVRTSVEEVRGTVDEVQGTVGTLGGNLETVTGELGTTTGRIDEIAGQIETLSTRTEEIAGRVEANAGQLGEVTATLEEARSDKTVALALAASNLRTAIDRGSSFGAELEAYAEVSGNQETVDALNQYAGAGVPTQAELLEQFTDAANRVLIAENVDGGEDASFTDQLFGSVRSLVKVRPAEDATGDGTEAVLARMERALTGGELDRVLAEADSLDQNAQAAMSSFLDDVRARQTANTVVQDALQGAIRPAG